MEGRLSGAHSAASAAEPKKRGASGRHSAEGGEPERWVDAGVQGGSPLSPLGLRSYIHHPHPKHYELVSSLTPFLAAVLIFCSMLK